MRRVGGVGAPPSLHCVNHGPVLRVNVMKAKPRFNHVPYSNRVAAFEKQMSRRFLNLLTKGAHAAIRPFPLLKLVCRLDSIVDD